MTTKPSAPSATIYFRLTAIYLGLVTTIFVGSRFVPRAIPALVACWIGAAYWFTSSTSFANPAITIARALSDTFAGIRPQDAPFFMVAQFLGAALATAFCAWLLKPIQLGTDRDSC